VYCRSKGKQIDIHAPDKMFIPAVAYVVSIKDKLTEGYIYRGEYLKKPHHNTLTYDRIPKNHIILFDIDKGLEDYLSYEDMKVEAERLDLEVVPLLTSGTDLTYDNFKDLLNTQCILGGQLIEGVVIKAYDHFGLDGKTLMGKYVREDFKEQNHAYHRGMNPSNADIIELLGLKYQTKARWNKAIQHLRDNGELSDEPKDIGALIKELDRDTKEECEEEISYQLFHWAWPKISRIIKRGFPEYYKDLLAQFEENDDER